MRPPADIIRRPVRIRRITGSRRVLPRVGLLAVAAYLAFAVPPALVASWIRARASGAAVREDAGAALVRQRGAAYAAAIARIRAVLPEDAEYLLLETPAHMIVRFDLAPRRAVFGGPPADVGAFLTSARLPSLPRWTVIAELGAPGPRLVETRLLAAREVLP
jgi:hypothetical protein